MGIFASLSEKIAADREAGRDVPPVIEELFLLIADSLDPQEKKDEEPKSDTASENTAE
ncbi:hypothetical protein [Rhizobium rhizogenes]|uniref:hypothetical protein n=1 Tax=Rhizobium rhizogenes TaxID=359 RepID=UPI0015736B6A|nr:hypothetical protein [Rhizobium rhizogenes]NTG09261.1 hypothetical protein [Rhizobium rhizogenes]